MSDSLFNRLEAVRYYNLLAHSSETHIVKAGDKYIHITSATAFDPVHMSEESFVAKARDMLSVKEKQIKILRRYLEGIIKEKDSR